MKKKILIIGYNFSPELTGIGKYTGEMVEWLAKKGYHCSVITTYPYYPYWKVQPPYQNRRFRYQKEIKEFASGGRIEIYRCPMYVPAKPSGAKRVLLDFSFFASALLQMMKLLPHARHGYVVSIVPSFQLGLLGGFYRKFRGAKHIYHVQDLQIEAARELGMIKSKKAIRWLLKLEKFILRRADIISSISEGMVSRIEGKTGRGAFLFPNWADTELFRPLPNKAQLKREFGFDPSQKIILYSGGIGEKQGLDAILYAAEHFRDLKELRFVICGTGPYKEQLESMAKEKKLNNVSFLPLQPMDQFNKFLNMADLHLVIQRTKASDLVMPSKLTTILSVGGVALITANKGTSLHALVEKHRMGILVDAENQKALNEGICEGIREEISQDISNNARHYAEEFLCKENVMHTFENALLAKS